jgi:hypothetical protein
MNVLQRKLVHVFAAGDARISHLPTFQHVVSKDHITGLVISFGKHHAVSENPRG